MNASAGSEAPRRIIARLPAVALTRFRRATRLAAEIPKLQASLGAALAQFDRAVPERALMRTAHIERKVLSAQVRLQRLRIVRIRADVPLEAMLQKVGSWLAVTDKHDLVQLLGRIGDGAIGGSPHALSAHVKILVLDDIDHSKLLQDPSYFPLLETNGILSFTHGATVAHA